MQKSRSTCKSVCVTAMKDKEKYHLHPFSLSQSTAPSLSLLPPNFFCLFCLLAIFTILYSSLISFYICICIHIYMYIYIYDLTSLLASKNEFVIHYSMNKNGFLMYSNTYLKKSYQLYTCYLLSSRIIFSFLSLFYSIFILFYFILLLLLLFFFFNCGGTISNCLVTIFCNVILIYVSTLIKV